MFSVSPEQLQTILSEIEDHPDLQSLVLHVEDLLEDGEYAFYDIDPLQDEIEPLYMALAGHKDLTVLVAQLRTALFL